MTSGSLWLSVLVGALQGIIEWLPISSEGGVSILLTLAGASPADAVRFALFLHAGTGLAATAYYRGELWAILRGLPRWRPQGPAAGETDRLTTFLAVATAASVVVAVVAYLTLLELATALSGGAFIALVGLLLVLTGLVQRFAGARVVSMADAPTLVDALLAGAGQGLAVLPGVSRSGLTVSVLLFRGQPGETAFRLSFLLSIPAAFGAGVLAVVEAGGLPAGAGVGGPVALVTAAVVGYASIDVLLRVVRRLPFWAVCVGLGGLAVVGGLVLVV